MRLSWPHSCHLCTLWMPSGSVIEFVAYSAIWRGHVYFYNFINYTMKNLTRDVIVPAVYRYLQFTTQFYLQYWKSRNFFKIILENCPLSKLMGLFLLITAFRSFIRTIVLLANFSWLQIWNFVFEKLLKTECGIVGLKKSHCIQNLLKNFSKFV